MRSTNHGVDGCTVPNVFVIQQDHQAGHLILFFFYCYYLFKKKEFTELKIACETN